MALSEKLLQKLVCPQCKGELEYKGQQNQLLCHECKLSYRVADDVPVLLLDEAEKIS